MSDSWINFSMSIQWVIGSNENEWTIATSSNTDKSYKPNVKEARHERIYMVWFHVHTIQKYAKLKLHCLEGTHRWSNYKEKQGNDSHKSEACEDWGAHGQDGTYWRLWILELIYFSPLQKLHRCPIYNYLLNFTLMVCALLCTYVHIAHWGFFQQK